LILFLASEKWVVARATKGENEGAALLDPGRARLFIWDGGEATWSPVAVISNSVFLLILVESSHVLSSSNQFDHRSFGRKASFAGGQAQRGSLCCTSAGE
jgi:hypothetical protein